MGRTPKFKGYDFCELIGAWDLPISENNGMDEKEDLKTLREYILSKWNWETATLDPVVKKDMVKFLDALVKTELSGYQPVYRAMKKLDDWEFVEVYLAMLPHMWT